MLARLPHPGLLAAGALSTLVAVSLLGLASAGGQGAGNLGSLAPYLARTVLSAARQATISTSLSLLLGVALALALNRLGDFAGRRVVMALFGAAMVAPTIVIVFGVASVYGRAGPFQTLAAMAGITGLPSIYGLHGVVLAMTVMNAPLVARVLVAAFAAVPAERTRLAQSLRFSPGACFRHLDWPVIRREAPGLAAFVFLLCFTSFAVVISLGGGPRNATLEIAIYEALRLEADFARAAALAALQIAICGVFVLVFGLFGARAPEMSGQAQAITRPDSAVSWLRLVDRGILAIALLLIAPVVLSVLAGATKLPSLLEPETARAAATSALVAVSAAATAVLLGLLLASAAEHAPLGRRDPSRARVIDLAVLSLVALPPFALVAGLFVLLRGSASLQTLGLFLVPLINALMALPFVYRLIASPLRQSAERHGRLAASLGISGRNRLRLVAWPLLKGPLAAAAALAAALSLGDFGVIALFGGGELLTLPYLMAERMGAYRLDEASAVALVLVALAGLLAYAADRAGAHA